MNNEMSTKLRTANSPTALDLTDRKLLNILQSEFPLVERPFMEMGGELGLTEDETIEAVRSLKDRNVVRQISAIFDTRRLGYKTTLVAMRFADEDLDAGARVINEHPGVSHNYARTGPFNLWFTIAVAPDESIEETVEEMSRRAGAETYRMMPTIRFFKIGVNFDMVKKEGNAASYSPDGYGNDGSKPANDDWKKAVPVTGFEKDVIRELQEDVDLVPRPFDGMVERLGISHRELFDLAADFQDRKIMRRFSAVLHHRRAGFKANSMAVWNVPEDRAVEVGTIMAGSRWVTHCYQRPTFPDWRYTHFSMIHATTRNECESVAKQISEATGIDDYMLLYSTREYKKTRVRYFV